MKTLNELRDEIHKNAVKHGFYEDESCAVKIVTAEGTEGMEEALKHAFFAQKIALIHSELSEALEADRIGYYHFHVIKNIGKPEKEIWRPVTGYESDYEVSNCGNVRSLDMEVWNGKVFYTKKGRMLQAGIGGTGYRTVALRGKTHKISRLVAKAFVENRVYI
jgi:hypothetical protein